MSLLLEIYDNNKKKHSLNEVTAVGATGTFTGRGGQDIDQLFAGGFHPDFGQIGYLLKQQLEDRFKKREWNDEITPELDVLFKLVDKDAWKDEVDKIVSSLKKRQKELEKFVNTSETEMQSVDIGIKYDKIVDKTEEMKKFVSETNDWKYIYENKKVKT